MNRQRGMTLIETLVALVLLSLLSVGLFAAFKTGQRTYAQVVVRNSQARDILITQRLLRNLIETAYPFEPDAHKNTFAMQGMPDDILLTAPSAGSEELGLNRYHVFLESREDGLQNLVVQYWIDRNGLAPDTAVGPSREVILEKLRNFEISYAAPSQSATGLVENDNWQSQWQQKPTLPQKVRVRVGFAASDRRVWSELIASPRITAAATCVFDVVSQACRGGA